MIFILDRHSPLSFFKWGCQLSLSSNVRPGIRILLEKVKGKFMNVIGGKCSFFFLLNMIHCVFEGENVNPDSDDHLDRTLRKV